jgi:CRP-like cAMP-binding protein
MFFRTPDPISARLVALGLSASAADRLSGAGTLLELPAGTTLCTRGERGLQAFFLLQGNVSVETPSGEVALGPGEVVGEIATLDSTRHRNATVVTTSPVTLLVFDTGTFRSLAATGDLSPRLVPSRAA